MEVSFVFAAISQEYRLRISMPINLTANAKILVIFTIMKLRILFVFIIRSQSFILFYFFYHCQFCSKSNIPRDRLLRLLELIEQFQNSLSRMTQITGCPCQYLSFSIVRYAWKVTKITSRFYFYTFSWRCNFLSSPLLLFLPFFRAKM